MADSDLREEVRRRYAVAATSGGCCGSGASNDSVVDDLAGRLYAHTDLAGLPTGATQASLGCGNPTAVAELAEGETVLDLGSGGGIDVLLSARRVGPTGFAYGVDMTDEMLRLARRNAAEAGAKNVEFRKGYIEDIPLPDGSVDVLISNCVINLSADKATVFAEIHRVLRDGGRLSITDIVSDDSLTPERRAERGDWVGCIAGALSVTEYERGLAEAGFSNISLTPAHWVEDGMYSMVIRATK